MEKHRKKITPVVEGEAEIQGTVTRVTYFQPETGFSVLKVKLPKKNDPVSVIVQAGKLYEGEAITAKGKWENHKAHGMQFKAAAVETSMPTQLLGIEKYLSSGLIKGIGPGYAKKIIEKFGQKAFEVIDQTPHKLQEIAGINGARYESILASWENHKAIREIMVFLQSHGMGVSKATKIYKTYGQKAIQIIQKNPYQLAKDIHGIGFKTADTMAQSLGIPKDSVIRAHAGLQYTLLQALSDGHCGLPKEKLLSEAEKLLEIPESVLLEGLMVGLSEKSLIEDSKDNVTVIFLYYLWHYEKTIAKYILSLVSHPPKWKNLKTKPAITWVEDHLKLTLSEGQKDAIRKLVECKLMVITGGPGVGKTSVIQSIIKVLNKESIKILLAAPTGRAAKRMTEATGLTSKTLHRLLETEGKGGQFQRNEQHPLEGDLLIIDEVSMVDVPMLRSVLLAMPKNMSLILVGDVDQLPSVGPGQVLKDLIESDMVPICRLTQIFRQAKTSHIITNAHSINLGNMPDLADKTGIETDFYFVSAKTPEECQHKLLKMVKERIPQKFGFDPLTDIQVLTPMNRSSLGAQSLNQLLQQALNSRLASATCWVERFGTKFYVGDKIIQTANNYDKDVFNGDGGVITAIDSDTKEVLIEFDGREVHYDLDELDEIGLAYALTIHKSQGSEYPVVVIPLMMQHYMMLKRNLLYTGITRGKKLVICVGEKKAVAMAVKGQEKLARCSKLREWLEQEA
jgi:exodeoxyribonuclease V alpha subunit